MKKVSALCVAFSLVCVLSSTSYARGPNNINFATITCNEFLRDISQADDETVGLVLMWLDGYLSGVTGDTNLNWQNFESFGMNLVDYCGNRPNDTMLRAAEAVGVEW